MPNRVASHDDEAGDMSFLYKVKASESIFVPSQVLSC